MQISILSANVTVLLISGALYCNSSVNADELDSKPEKNIKKLSESAKGILNIPSDNGLQYTFEHYNEDVNLNISQLITKYGYPFEKHHVVTEDGYKLSLFRIPRKGPPVFLMHGLLMSADDWVTAGPESGIAYLLASEGYDVWMGNARGNKHSRQHLTLSADSAEFWDFSWDEIGRYDLPSMIDYVLHVTGQQRLQFVGFSQGTTVFFVMCSERPEYNDKVSLMVALAAVTTMPNLKCPLFTILNNIANIEMLFTLIRDIGFNEFLPSNLLIKTIVSVLCDKVKSAKINCSDVILYRMCWFSYSQLNVTNLPVILGHTPAGAATKQFIHFSQGFLTGKFRRFDYGIEKNKNIYGSKTPPSYPIEKITTPVALFCSETDWLATMTDVQILRKKLQNIHDFYIVPSEDFGHLDYLFSKNVKRLVFARLLYLLKIH